MIVADGQEKLGVEALAAAARLGGRDALRQLPQVRAALFSRFQAFNSPMRQQKTTASGVPVAQGAYVLGLVGAEDELVAVVAERRNNVIHGDTFDADQKRTEDMFLAFLEEVLRG